MRLIFNMRNMLILVVLLITYTVFLRSGKIELLKFLVFCLFCLGIIIFAIVYLFWADRKIFFTFHKRNSIQGIVKGKGEEFTGKIIFPSVDQYLDDKSNVVDFTPGTHSDEIDEHVQKPNWIGMYPIKGYPFHTIFKYHKIWQEWVTTEKIIDGKPVVVRSLGPMRNEMTPYLFTKRQEYGLMILEAENKEGYPLDFEIAWYCKPVNYKKAIIDVKDSFGQMQTQIQGATNLFVKTETFLSLDALVLKDGRNPLDVLGEQDRYSEFIVSLNKQLVGEKNHKGMVSELGWVIIGAKIMNMSFSSTASKEIREAVTKVGVVTQKKLADIIDAEGKKQVAILESEGESKAMDNITESKRKRFELFKDNPNAIQIEIAEKTFEKSKLTTYVAGGSEVKPVIPLDK